MDNVKQAAQILTDTCHGQAKQAGWWADPKTGLTATRRVDKDEAMESLQWILKEHNEGNIVADSGFITALQTLQDFILTRNRGELLMLMVSELAEAMEADRKGLVDDKLPHRIGLEVELADAAIRIFDTAGGEGLDVAGAMVEKLAFNAVRPDHKPENRAKDNGKKY